MKRIQRKRTKGWRMPEGARYVGRPSRWGNEWRVGDVCNYTIHATLYRGTSMYHDEPITLDATTATEHFRWAMAMPMWRAGRLDALRGKDLACWCPLDQPCHADVLLELGNQ